jgi:serine/threonine protein kinase
MFDAPARLTLTTSNKMGSLKRKLEEQEEAGNQMGRELPKEIGIKEVGFGGLAARNPSAACDLMQPNSVSTPSDGSNVEAKNARSTNQPALDAWTRKFRSPQVQLQRTDPSPFVAGRRLGGGGVGIVYETHLDGIALALKRTYTRKLNDNDLNEAKILSQISRKRHEHIVELIGSYIHQQRSGFEICILISPVAHCDMASYLHDLDALDFWIHTLDDTGAGRRRDEIQSAVETLCMMWSGRPWSNVPRIESYEELEALRLASQQRLCRSFLCIAKALEYLHQYKIRHKDLKPSQILLSPSGLWLTDFGWSIDMSAYSHSATSSGDNITFRYQAPERAARQACSRSEDIFTMGCTFLEMAVRLTNSAAATISSWKSNTGDKWSFQANLSDYPAWVEPLQLASQDLRTTLLVSIISQMMRQDHEKRPGIQEVVDLLSYEAFSYVNPRYPFGDFFSACCRTPQGLLSESKSPIDMLWNVSLSASRVR